MRFALYLLGLSLLVAGSPSISQKQDEKNVKDVFGSLEKIKECLRAAKSVQIDPTNAEKGAHFTKACQMFLKKLELTKFQKKVLEKFGFVDSKSSNKASKAKKLPVVDNREKSLPEMKQAPELLNTDKPSQVHLKREASEKLPPSPDEQGYEDIPIQQLFQPLRNFFAEQQLQHPFHQGMGFGQFPNDPSPRQDNRHGINGVPNVPQQPDINLHLMLQNFDPTAHLQNAPLFQNPNFQNIPLPLQQPNEFQFFPPSQVGSPNLDPFVPPDNGVPPELSEERIMQVPFNGRERFENDHPHETEPQQQADNQFEYFHRFPNRFDEL